ncbi:hypothetical protein [Diaminobutyricibacter sp. McL0608]|uniref:hypothetical protein n=1 Tax=Leifsonia sp. McL0608 TaxID=3143537 RepID=UPI0031F31DB5
MPTPQLRITAAIAAAAGLALLLAGCGGTAQAAPKTPKATHSAVASAQTKGEACDILATAYKTLSDLNSPANVAAMKADPAKALANLKTLKSTVSDAADKVSEPTVKKSADSVTKTVTVYVNDIVAIASHPVGADTSKLGKEIGDLSTSLIAVGKTCS